MKMLMEEMGGCLFLVLIGRILLRVMADFYSLTEHI